MDPCLEISPLHDWAISSTTDVPFYLDFVRVTTGDILEIGTGTGRIASLIASVGKHVLAIDTAPKQLRYALQRWREDGGGAAPLYLAADMRNLCIQHRFELILATHRSFERVLLDMERIRLFQDCASLLVSNGLLVVHVWSPPTEAIGGVREKVEELPASDEHGPLRVIRREERDPVRKIRRYTRRIEEKEGLKRTWDCPPMDLRWYTATDLESLGLRAGLRVDNRFSNFQREAYSPGAAELIWVYRKR
ncbi:MAG TPA: class I SAM-dependent methyltransferase [Candidatus Hydrogenedentes bacterium]|nr:class I SAM-dependent methyltransferase [Candidatus Hydrogenedentota bacterium]HOL75864.1 class I SAM-dependent methyltransferase [Candidatus Hydrogenedentota bacterium]HPO86365.1 class I SAM-dependent methyltransferase [Candidatus Hydrogenedentota bacterium]